MGWLIDWVIDSLDDHVQSINRWCARRNFNCCRTVTSFSGWSPAYSAKSAKRWNDQCSQRRPISSWMPVLRSSCAVCRLIWCFRPRRKAWSGSCHASIFTSRTSTPSCWPSFRITKRNFLFVWCNCWSSSLRKTNAGSGWRIFQKKGWFMLSINGWLVD